MKRLVTAKGETTLVDSQDWPYLSKFTWCKDRKGYFVARSGILRDKRLNRVIAERAGMNMSGQIDHENRDKSNNQRYNLRPAANGPNRANSKLNANNESGFRGVSLKKRRKRNSKRKVRSDSLDGRVVSQINANREKIHLGYYPDTKIGEIKAAFAYDVAALRVFKEFKVPACLNNVGHLLDAKIKRRIRQYVLQQLANKGF